MKNNTDSTASTSNGWWSEWWVGSSSEQVESGTASTRERILLAAFQEVHRNGFQAASIQNIINAAGVTKGALYHYFASKEEIGLALLDEIFTRYVEFTWIAVLDQTDDPIKTLTEHLQATGEQMTEQDIALGCPLDHFAGEMAPIDDRYQQRIEALYTRKRDAIAGAIRRGQSAGTVVADADADAVAVMIIATLQGCMAMAKSSRSLDTLMMCGNGLLHYLQQLRPLSSEQ